MASFPMGKCFLAAVLFVLPPSFTAQNDFSIYYLYIYIFFSIYPTNFPCPRTYLQKKLHVKISETIKGNQFSASIKILWSPSFSLTTIFFADNNSRTTICFKFLGLPLAAQNSLFWCWIPFWNSYFLQYTVSRQIDLSWQINLVNWQKILVVLFGQLNCLLDTTWQKLFIRCSNVGKI